MDSPRFGIPIELAEDLGRELNLKTAIETGTWEGHSAAALASIFEGVWTIELSPQLHSEAAERHQDEPGIEFLQGESSRVLAELLPKIESPALFWLDAHWGGSVGAGKELQCPVLQEITVIDQWHLAKDSCILIDDARWFLGPPDPKLRREDWPTFLEILDLLRDRHERYVTILEDVIIAGPPACRPVLDSYWTKHQWKDLETDRYRLEAEVTNLEAELDAPPGVAFKRLIKSLLPERVKQRIIAARTRR